MAMTKLVPSTIKSIVCICGEKFPVEKKGDTSVILGIVACPRCGLSTILIVDK